MYRFISARILSAGMFLALWLGIPAWSAGQGKGVITDPRDQRTYHWIKVGNQTWFTENLAWNDPANSWIYNADTAYEYRFGRLYTWQAAQTACPKGWRVPAVKDWNLLIQSLGGEGDVVAQLKSFDTIGTRARYSGAGFISTLLGGVRHSDGTFTGIDVWGGFWTSGSEPDGTGNNLLFAKGAKEPSPSSNDKQSGFSVRCVKGK